MQERCSGQERHQERDQGRGNETKQLRGSATTDQERCRNQARGGFLTEFWRIFGGYLTDFWRICGGFVAREGPGLMAGPGSILERHRSVAGALQERCRSVAGACCVRWRCRSVAEARKQQLQRPGALQERCSGQERHQNPYAPNECERTARVRNKAAGCFGPGPVPLQQT